MPLPPVAIIVSRYNASVTDALLRGALEEYAARGGDSGSVAVFDAPGSFELTSLALAAAQSGRYRGVVALGCLIRGETRHDRHIAQAVAHGLTEVSLKTGVPVAFGVLTVETAEQARARSGGEKGNKGADAMGAVLDAVATVEAIRRGDSAPVVAGKPDKAGTRR